MGSLGFGEILLIGIVALLAFGGERLPEAARRAGRAAKQLRDVVDSARREIVDAVEDRGSRPVDPPDPPSPPLA